jgi:hypothetical protein
MSSRSIVTKWSGLAMVTSPWTKYLKINSYKHMIWPLPGQSVSKLTLINTWFDLSLDKVSQN